MIKVCPHCDSPNVRKRNQRNFGPVYGDIDHPWFCWDCKEVFKEADERERHEPDRQSPEVILANALGISRENAAKLVDDD